MNVCMKYKCQNIIDISQGIDINKTNASKECDICHYCSFKGIGSNYDPYLCNGFHNFMKKALNFNDVAIFSVKGSHYRIHFSYVRKKMKLA